jgi:multidrug efflux system membrane fusion protein
VTVRRVFKQWSVVEKGLAPGEKVVTDGQLRLAPGVKVTIKKAG